MPPLSAPELFACLWNGSIPALGSRQAPDRNVFFSSYLSTYTERDVRDLSGSVDALKFNRFVTAAAARCSQLPNNNQDTREIDVILEGDGKLCPLEIKKTASPDQRLTRVFGVIDKSPLQVGTGAILCMADKFSAIDRNNLIIPVWMI